MKNVDLFSLYYQPICIDALLPSVYDWNQVLYWETKQIPKIKNAWCKKPHSRPHMAPDKGANRFVSFTFSIVSPDILLVNPIQ